MAVLFGSVVMTEFRYLRYIRSLTPEQVRHWLKQREESTMRDFTYSNRSANQDPFAGVPLGTARSYNIKGPDAHRRTADDAMADAVMAITTTPRTL